MSTRPFVYHFSPSLYDTDAAGVMFFGHLFRHLHDAYEAFLSHAGQPLSRILAEGLYHLPIVHTQADYRRPMQHGQRLRIELWVENLEEAGFSIDYRILDERGAELASARSVHACIDAAKRRRTALPKTLRAVLQDLTPGAEYSSS